LGERIQVGLIHVRKTLTVTAEPHSFRLGIDGETLAVVPWISAREVHR